MKCNKKINQFHATVNLQKSYAPDKKKGIEVNTCKRFKKNVFKTGIPKKALVKKKIIDQCFKLAVEFNVYQVTFSSILRFCRLSQQIAYSLPEFFHRFHLEKC